jgi:hypothetical protein
VTAAPSLDAPGRGSWMLSPKSSDSAVRKLTGWLIDEKR